jgi:hypothetical protein
MKLQSSYWTFVMTSRPRHRLAAFRLFTPLA